MNTFVHSHRRQTLFLATLLLTPVLAAHAADYYVARAGQPSAANYTSWGTAASNIADVIALPPASGSTIWVSNGTYTVDTHITVGDFTVRSYNNGALDRDGTIIKANYPTTTNRCFLLNNAAAVVDSFTITNGCVSGEDGGGAYISAGILRNCLITGNMSTNNGPGGGGGVYLTGANSVVSNCNIIANATYGGSSATGGGGVKVAGGATVWNSLIKNNESPIYWSSGGGVHTAGGNVFNCTIISNTALDGYSGGNVWVNGSGSVLRNCVIKGGDDGRANVAGGIAGSGSGATIDNCTVTENFGHGIGVRRNANFLIRNTISYFNTGNALNQFDPDQGTFTVSNSCITATNSITVGSNNITGSPAFEHRAGGDFRLTPWSRGVDGGLVLPWMSGAEDRGGNDRISPNGLADIGAYETTAGGPPTTYYVQQQGQTPLSPYTGGWASAASNIQDVIDIMRDGTTILVKNATYTLTEEVPVVYVTIRSDNGGAIDPEGTVIRGGYPTSSNRLFNMSHADAVVDGFTITNGHTVGPLPLDYPTAADGGGVYMTAGTLQNCIVAGNYCTNANGGGVYADGPDGLISNCQVIGNECWYPDAASVGRGGGGGVRLLNGAQIWDSLILHNKAPLYCGGGGAVHAANNTLIMNCSIISNTASSGYYGGGVFFEGSGNTVRNCLILGNDDGRFNHGSGVSANTGRDNAIENCTILGNQGRQVATRVGDYATTYRVVNTISRYPDPTYLTYALYAGNLGTLIASNSCASATNYITAGTGNFTNDPQFADEAGGNLRPVLGSPCVDGGVNLPWMATAVDLDGDERLSGGAVDIGAYEYIVYGTIITVQ